MAAVYHALFATGVSMGNLYRNQPRPRGSGLCYLTQVTTLRTEEKKECVIPSEAAESDWSQILRCLGMTGFEFFSAASHFGYTFKARFLAGAVG